MSIYPCTAHYPGLFIVHPDPLVASAWRSRLNLLGEQFLDACIALSLFEEASIQADQMSLSCKSELEYVRRNVKTMRVMIRLPWMHARSFLFALDNFGKMLKVLADEQDVPSQLSQVADSYKKAFPDLVEVRNSAHHPEDRERGMGRNEQPIKAQPVMNGIVHAPHGGVMVSGVVGSKMTMTMADGRAGEIEVSRNTIQIVDSIMQQAINCFAWKRPFGLEEMLPEPIF